MQQSAQFFGASSHEEVPETEEEEEENSLLAAFRALNSAQVCVVDTVFFSDGKPVLWIFSDKNGVIRRRHRRRLTWVEIHERMQRLGRRKRRGGPDEPIAVLRWKKGDEVVSTLLEWRRLRDMCREIPENAGPTLTSWQQVICLQPYCPPRLGSASGVFSHRVGSSNGDSLVLPNQSREFMNWPGPAPRSKNDTRYPSSQLVREESQTHRCLARVSKEIDSALAKAHFTGFVAEYVFERKHRPVLIFLHDLSRREPPEFSTTRPAERVTTTRVEATTKEVNWWWRRRCHRPDGHPRSTTSRTQRIRLATLARMVSTTSAY